MTYNAKAITRFATFTARTSLLAALSLMPVALSASAFACPEHDKAAAVESKGVQVAQVAATEDITVDDITIAQPWSRATAKGARVAGGYLVLNNKGGKDEVLLSGTTDIADKFEMHEMALTDGVMRMRKVEGGLPIKAGESLELKPGSYHLMFMDLKRPLMEGDTFTVDLEFKNAGKVPVKFIVRGIGARDSGQGQSHDHGKDNKAPHAH